MHTPLLTYPYCNCVTPDTIWPLALNINLFGSPKRPDSQTISEKDPLGMATGLKNGPLVSG